MCFKTIPVVSRPRSNITRRRQSNPANLRPISTSSTTPLSFSMALWNCQSAVNKADFISTFSLQSTLSILGLTETWIRPEDSATPAALSNNFSFSHTPRQVGRGGGTGLLISNNWKYSTHSPLCNYNSFESHSITVMAPIKLQIVVIYRAPGQILAPFLEELDGLLSSFMEDGTPLLVFGDFNIHLEKPYATDFHSLLASFDLKRLTTTSTHKSGNQLDLIYTRDCTADNILVQPLHISDHFFIKFTLHFATRVPPTPLPVTFRRNLRSLSPSHLSSVVSSSLPSLTHFSSLDVNAATDTLCSTLTTCLDDICPLSSRPARTAPSNPWLSDVLREHRTRLRAAERKWRKSNELSDLSMYQSFLSSFSAEVHTAKSSHFHNKINNAPDMRNLFRTFNSPPLSPSTTSHHVYNSWWTLQLFLQTKLKQSVVSFHLHSYRTPNQLDPLLNSHLLLLSPHWGGSIQTSPLQSSYNMSSRPYPLTPSPSNLSHTLTSTHTHYQHISPHRHLPHCIQAGSSNPTAQKTYIKHFSLENYRPVSLLPFIAKTLEQVVFNQVSLFLSQNNKLDAKQSGFRSGHSTETALLSVTEALRIAKADSKSSVLILLDLSAAFDTVNHQILLSTLSSLDITGIPLRWFESYLTGRSFRVAWGREVSKAHQLVTGVPQGSVLGPLLFSTIHYITGSHHTGTWLLLPFLCWWHTALSLISTRWSNGSCTDLRLPGGHLSMDERTPSTAQPGKDWASCLPCNSNSTAWFTIQLGSSTITPSASVRNLGVIFDDQLTFKEHIAKTARSCRFALHNIRKIRPFLTEHAAQLLVQALVISRLDYCNALLAGLPSNTIKPLQMIQNAAARLVFNEPKRAHVTPLFVSLHWLPVAARIQFKTLMLAYRTTTGSAPTYFHSLLRIYIPSRSLRSASERRLVVPSQRGSKSLSRTFSFTVPGRWNDLPTPIRNAGSLSIFKQQLKTHLFQLYLTT